MKNAPIFIHVMTTSVKKIGGVGEGRVWRNPCGHYYL